MTTRLATLLLVLVAAAALFRLPSLAGILAVLAGCAGFLIFCARFGFF